MRNAQIKMLKKKREYTLYERKWNYNGGGHSTAYFKRMRMSETEYLAHAFENAFLGNRVFQKYLPDIYNEMIAYIRTLKPIK